MANAAIQKIYHFHSGINLDDKANHDTRESKISSRSRRQCTGVTGSRNIINKEGHGEARERERGPPRRAYPHTSLRCRNELQISVTFPFARALVAVRRLLGLIDQVALVGATAVAPT